MKLNEETIKALPAPDKGTASPILQGPRSKGRRHRGALAFASPPPVLEPSCLTIAFVGANTASPSAHGRIGQRSRPFATHATCASGSIAARTRLTIGRRPRRPRPSPTFLTISLPGMSATRKGHYGAPTTIESAFERLVKPRIGKLGVYELRRSHVAEMLDRIEDENGPVMADRTRAYLRKALSWYAERDDQFNLTPFRARKAES